MTTSSLTAFVLAFFLAGSHAADKPVKTPAAKARRAAPPPAAIAPAAPEQIEAARLVFYGRHDCEFNQAVDVTAHPRHPGYVDVRFGKIVYLMKPVQSPTGALRLEDVRGETLWVQIPAKSMLMNVKAGRRLVDQCVGDRHREWIHETAKAKALAEATALEAARAASAPPAAGAASEAADQRVQGGPASAASR